MSHPTTIPQYPINMEDLAQDVACLRYDKVAEFLGHLSNELQKQKDGDEARGRVQLASRLEETVHALYFAKDRMWETWNLCAPYECE